MYTTTDFFIRLVLASLFGAMIGLERELRAKGGWHAHPFSRSHGQRTLHHSLTIRLRRSPQGLRILRLVRSSRIAAQVVTGIGFIGAGTIIFQKHVVRGLTTAAGLWVTSAIGMTAGAGLYALALTSTVLVLLCLEAVNYVTRRFGVKKIMVTFSTEKHETVKSLLKELQQEGIDFDSYQMHRSKSEDGSTQFSVTLEVKVKRNNYRERVMSFVKDFDGVSIEMME